jgi:tetratricopeptide (TPR) repeat protein
MNELRSACLALAIVSSLLTAPLHAATSSKDEARALFAQGQAAYEKGDYDGALKLFESAVQAFTAPALYFNIAQWHRRRDDPVRARGARKYKQLDPKIPPKVLADVDAQIAEARVLIEERERQQAEQAAADAAKKAVHEAEQKAAQRAAAQQAAQQEAAQQPWGDTVVLGAVAGGVVVAVTGSLVAWSLLAPGPTPPPTSLGTVDLR